MVTSQNYGFFKTKDHKILKTFISKPQNSLHSQCRIVLEVDMHSLLLVEITNDVPFSPPETKYDEPFQMTGNTSIICFDESFHLNPTLFF